VVLVAKMRKKSTQESFYQSKYGNAPKDGDNKDGESAKRPYDGERKPYARKEGEEGKRPFEKRGDKPFEGKRPYDGEHKPYARKEGEESKRPFEKRGDKPFEGKRPYDGERKPYARKEGEEGKRPFEKRGDKPFEGKRPYDGERKPYARKEGEEGKRPFEKRGDKPFEGKRPYDGERKPYARKEGEEGKRPFEKRGDKPFEGERKPYAKKDGIEEKRPFEKKKAGIFDHAFDDEKKSSSSKKSRGEDRVEYEAAVTAFKEPKGIAGKPFPKKVGHDKKRPGTIDIAGTEEETIEDIEGATAKTKFVGDDKRRFPTENQVLNPSQKKGKYDDEDEVDEVAEIVYKQPEQMPLNKYIAHCGICSRRDAVEFVKQGKVRVNGELVTEPGYKIKPEDTVIVAGKKILPQKNLTYILLNKPKGFITTTDDEKDRDTVMQLVASSGVERLYPVGRLDRQTTGLIIMTNDGEFAQKLAHPKYMIKKVYQVTLDKSLTKPDFQKILAGITLEDGLINVDSLAYLDERNEIGLEIHSGRNRIVRRIFESLGYVVEKLDRVMYAGLTKKNLPRGKWRLLTEREVILLKHFKS
jgi:23S rRNA pseudouridine2605 synthase